MITIPLGPLPVRVILLVALLAGLSVLGGGAVRSAVSDLLMTFVVPSPTVSLEDQVQWADVALKYSPRDPFIRLKHGGVYLKAANEKMEESWRETAVDEFRAATKMSPDDYRVWLALGRALDRGGDVVDARAAFERSIELAPDHFDPRWAFGNYLLRAGDREGSFAQMRLALSNRPSALPLIFDYAWGVYKGDGKAIAAAFDAPRLPRQIKSQLSAQLILRGRVGDGMAVWREITAPSVGDTQRVTEALFNTGNFSKAYEVWTSVEIPNRPARDENSLLSNGGFESALPRGVKTPFLTWQINPIPGAKFLQDQKAPRDGRRSLRAGFDVRGNQFFIIASQTVPAKPSTGYRLEYSIKSDKLLSLSNPLVEIFDSAYALDQRNRVHVASQPTPNGESEWTDYKLEFTTGAQTEALTVRITRPACSEPPCPIEGHIWFDEFKLTEKAK